MQLNKRASALQSFLPPITRKNTIDINKHTHIHTYIINTNIIIVFFYTYTYTFYSGTPSFGAWININHDFQLEIEKFTAAKYQGKHEKPRPSAPIRGGWY